MAPFDSLFGGSFLPRAREMDEDPDRAPTYSIPETKLAAVEHPMLIMNVDKALTTFGKNNVMKPLFSRKAGNIPLYLRPDDPVARPLPSHVAPCHNVVLKVTVPKRTGRKRKRGSDGPFEGDVDTAEPKEGRWSADAEVCSRSRLDDPRILQRKLQDTVGRYEVEAVGTISRTHRYRGLADFQYDTSNSPFVAKFVQQVLPGEVSEMRKFTLSNDVGPDAPVDMMPPPHFTMLPLPFNYQYLQSQGAGPAGEDEGGDEDGAATPAPSSPSQHHAPSSSRVARRPHGPKLGRPSFASVDAAGDDDDDDSVPSFAPPHAAGADELDHLAARRRQRLAQHSRKTAMDTFVAHDAYPAPSAPPTTLRRLVVPGAPRTGSARGRFAANRALAITVERLRRVFEERPVWTRRAVTNRMLRLRQEERDRRSALGGERVPLDPPELTANLVKRALQYVCYQFRGGPWRDALIRFGVDPRTDPEYRVYQTLLFKARRKRAPLRHMARQQLAVLDDAVATAAQSGAKPSGRAPGRGGKGRGAARVAEGRFSVDVAGEDDDDVEWGGDDMQAAGPEGHADNRADDDGRSQKRRRVVDGDDDGDDSDPALDAPSRRTRHDSHLFDGSRVDFDGKVWQVCDVTDPLLADLFRNAAVVVRANPPPPAYFAVVPPSSSSSPPPPPSAAAAGPGTRGVPGPDLGWAGFYSRALWAHAKAIMKTKLVAAQIGRADLLTDDDFRETAASARKWDRIEAEAEALDLARAMAGEEGVNKQPEPALPPPPPPPAEPPAAGGPSIAQVQMRPHAPSFSTMSFLIPGQSRGGGVTGSSAQGGDGTNGEMPKWASIPGLPQLYLTQRERAILRDRKGRPVHIPEEEVEGGAGAEEGEDAPGEGEPNGDNNNNNNNNINKGKATEMGAAAAAEAAAAAVVAGGRKRGRLPKTSLAMRNWAARQASLHATEGPPPRDIPGRQRRPLLSPRKGGAAAAEPGGRLAAVAEEEGGRAHGAGTDAVRQARASTAALGGVESTATASTAGVGEDDEGEDMDIDEEEDEDAVLARIEREVGLDNIYSSSGAEDLDEEDEDDDVPLDGEEEGLGDVNLDQGEQDEQEEEYVDADMDDLAEGYDPEAPFDEDYDGATAPFRDDYDEEEDESSEVEDDDEADQEDEDDEDDEDDEEVAQVQVLDRERTRP